jgi:uncharacterized membrane protein YdjX (TVP38/TMEM64 family)
MKCRDREPGFEPIPTSPQPPLASSSTASVRQEASGHGTDDPEARSPSRAALRAGLLLLLLALLGAVMLTGGGQLLDEARARVDSWGVWAPVAFAVLYALAVAALAPGAVLTASAGALFGVMTGTVTVLVGATGGAALSFALARWLGRPAVARWTGEGRLARLDALLSRRGFTAVLLLRLVPLFPFALVNYATGVMSVRFLPYLTATAIGIVPGTVAYVGLGGTPDDPSSPAFWAALAALTVLAVGGGWAARRVRARERTADGGGGTADVGVD